MRWSVPEDGSHPRFAFLGEIVAVTATRIFRLQGDGAVADIGPTPLNFLSTVHTYAPVLMPSVHGPIACFGTSVYEANAARGYCARAAPRGFEYATDFGEFGAALGDAAIATPPFTCGDGIISNRRGVVQLRRQSDGVRIATANILAQRGSTCLGSEGILVVGRHEVRVLELHHLGIRWRHAVQGTITSAVACGGKVFLLLEKNPLPVPIDLPRRLSPSRD